MHCSELRNSRVSIPDRSPRTLSTLKRGAELGARGPALLRLLHLWWYV